MIVKIREKVIKENQKIKRFEIESLFWKSGYNLLYTIVCSKFYIPIATYYSIQ